MTNSQPASLSIPGLISPVKAPLCCQWQFWAASLSGLPRISFPTMVSPVNGGASTTVARQLVFVSPFTKPRARVRHSA